jgi:hypothetical protein
MKIPQPDHGGNGVRASVVNQTLPCAPVDLRGHCPCPVPPSNNLLQQIITRSGSSRQPLNLFDCATGRSFCGLQGRKGTFAMIETVTAVLGLVSAGIFLAHAFEGYRSRA